MAQTTETLPAVGTKLSDALLAAFRDNFKAKTVPAY